MDIKNEPRILKARLSYCVVISFDDGNCAAYSAALLYENLSRADHITIDPELD